MSAFAAPNWLIALSISVTMGCQADREVIELAEAAFNSGDLDTAKAKYETFIAEYPTSEWRGLAERQLSKTKELAALRSELDDAVDLLGSPLALRAAEEVYLVAVGLVRRVAELHSSLIDTIEVLRVLDSKLTAIGSRVIAAEGEAQRQARRSWLLRKVGAAVDLVDRDAAARERPTVVVWRTAALRDSIGTVTGVPLGGTGLGNVVIVREIAADFQAARVSVLSQVSGDASPEGWITTESLGRGLTPHLCGNRLFGNPGLIQLCRQTAPRR